MDEEFYEDKENDMELEEERVDEILELQKMMEEELLALDKPLPKKKNQGKK